MDVSPFSNEYDALKDVPIASAATAYDNPDTGETIILEFHQGLWFGDRMEHSLINPNQCRANGIDLCDDPWDRYRELAITTDEATIPLQYRKNIVYWKTRAPTVKELKDPRLIHIEMTSDKPWIPSTMNPPKSKEEEEYSKLVASLRIDERVVSSTSPTDPILKEDAKEYDTLLSSCSPIYCDELLAQRLVAQVKVASPLTADRRVDALRLKDRHYKMTAEELARKLECGIETAQETLKVTTMNAIRSGQLPLSRRYRTDIMGRRLRTLRQTWYTDTMFSKYKGLNGGTCLQVVTNGRYVHPDPMERKAGAGDAMKRFGNVVGIPESLVYDGAKEQNGKNTEFDRWVRKNHIDTRNTEPYSSFQNKAELGIREIRRRWRRLRRRKGCSHRLWEYGIPYLSELACYTWRPDTGRTPYEEVTGETPDISAIADFEFYDWVWYWDGVEGEAKIGRWLGPSHGIGSGMTYWILPISCEPISRGTVQHMTKEEQLDPVNVKLMDDYTKSVDAKLNDDAHVLSPIEGMFHIQDDDEDDEDAYAYKPVEASTIPDADDYTPDAYDDLISASLLLPNEDGTMIRGTVRKRLKDQQGNPIGRRHPTNAMFDDRKYEVEFSDGTAGEYYGNVISEHMLSQVDSEGRQYLLMEEITDHRKDGRALSKEDGWIQVKPGRPKRRKITTVGWSLRVRWKDGSHDWVPLKDLKESYPVQVAEYAKAAGIEEEPAFAWWVNEVIRRRNRIIKKVKSRYWKTTQKFGIDLPHSAEEALKLDEKNGNDYWRKAIEKEMKKVKGHETFLRYDRATPEELRKTPQLLPGFKNITLHMVFDIKMDGLFTRKARLVADGHKTGEAPAHTTYSSVVSRESVRLAFLHAALNGLEVMSCDVSNAYLNAPCKEKIWIEAGPEFGSEKGTVQIIQKALYGLKTSGNSWRQVLSQFIEEHLGFKNSKADPDVYIKAACKPNGEKYYEWLLVYVDDILCVSHNPKAVMDKIASVYDLKDSVQAPERYLGANVKKVERDDGTDIWTMDGHEYVSNAVKIVEDMLREEGATLRTKQTHRPFPEGYKPELDVSNVLSPELASRYSQLMGMLRWAVELGRVDILLEQSLLASHLAEPREGHLEAVYQIFSYLKKHKKAPIGMDPHKPYVDPKQFKQSNWETSIYDGACEELPPNFPKPLGRSIQIVCFVDASHANDKITRRSQTGFIIYVNNAPIDWFSKKQTTVESSTFGSEFVAMRIAMERLKALRYKLRMLGIPLDGEAMMLGDNQSVVDSASLVERRLSKKHNSICWHAVREACAAGWLQVGWEPTASNIADVFTKVLPTEQRNKLLKCILYRLTPPEDD